MIRARATTSTATVQSRAEGLRARLDLKPSRPVSALLDGAWWPRSRDPEAELPGLIQVLDREAGIVERLMLGAGEWDAHPKRLFVDGRAVRLGWYVSQPAGLLTATTRGARIDLLVVSSDCDEDVAVPAMAVATDPSNTRHAPDIMAAFTTTPVLSAEAPAESTWEGEGGRPR